jgi:hypothetical protein
MVEMTIQVPNALAERLQAERARLPEVLALGLNDLSPVPNSVYRYILDFLISRPSPEAVVNFSPAPEMQTHVSELLKKSRADQLTSAEAGELDEYIRIDHLITLLKAHALPFLLTTST